MSKMCEMKYREEEEVITKIRRYIDVKYDEIEETVDLDYLKKKKNIQVSDKEISIKKKLIDIFEVDDKKYYLYSSKSGKLYITSNINFFCKVKQKIHCHITKKYIYFWGKFTNINHKISNFDKIYLNEKKIGKMKRMSKMKIFKDYMIMRVKISKIVNSGEIHNDIRIGKNKDVCVPLTCKRKHKGINYIAKKKINDNYIIVRSAIKGNRIITTNVKFEPEYRKINLLKNYFARKFSKIMPDRKVNLLFEKETNKANESGYYVFEKIMELENNRKLDSKNYFVIDKKSDDYEKIKKKYGKSIIEKYSFKHYLNIYLSKYFISSELSNHVLNPRLYIRSLNQCITKKPLVFLQHGIMFAKPVENPAASGFKKQNAGLNFYKCVISSDLEASQFYKLGFENKDLIKCGLAKFDISKRNENADKIMLMFTYRYWEEALVMNAETIKETTYYKIYMRVINAFEENNLIDKLIISCHPKFADALISADPKFEKYIEKDINKGLENAKIFITDYSSASYDAHYRGAYIIYDWEERDYLIENYKAIPPINEENCDGVPVYSTNELIEQVKNAISKDGKMDAIYEERYRKINEFYDGKNGDRLINELLKLNII